MSNITRKRKIVCHLERERNEYFIGFLWQKELTNTFRMAKYARCGDITPIQFIIFILPKIHHSFYLFIIFIFSSNSIIQLNREDGIIPLLFGTLAVLTCFFSLSMCVSSFRDTHKNRRKTHITVKRIQIIIASSK